jgi:hypothetical protein
MPEAIRLVLILRSARPETRLSLKRDDVDDVFPAGTHRLAAAICATKQLPADGEQASWPPHVKRCESGCRRRRRSSDTLQRKGVSASQFRRARKEVNYASRTRGRVGAAQSRKGRSPAARSFTSFY